MCGEYFYGLKFKTLIHPLPLLEFTFPIVIPKIGIRAMFFESKAYQILGNILEIELYKLGIVIENKEIETQLIVL